MKIILDETFEKREDLDAFVSTRLGQDQTKNINYELEVSPAEAQKLSLSNNVKVHGVKVKIKS